MATCDCWICTNEAPVFYGSRIEGEVYCEEHVALLGFSDVAAAALEPVGLIDGKPGWICLLCGRTCISEADALTIVRRQLS